MDELLDMIAADESPIEVSGKIKDLLFAKASEKIDELRPAVALSMFDQTGSDEE